MPITPKTGTPRSKPYSKSTNTISSAADKTLDPSSDSDSKPNTSPSEAKTIRAQTANGRSWDGSELNTLFDFVMTRDGRGWGEAVPGRTANQAQQTWKKSILPYIRKCLDERGAGVEWKKE